MRQRSGSRIRIRKQRPGGHGTGLGVSNEGSPESRIFLSNKISARITADGSKLLQGGERVVFRTLLRGLYLNYLPVPITRERGMNNGEVQGRVG